MKIVKYGLELDQEGLGILVKEESKNFPVFQYNALNRADKVSDIMRIAFQINKKAEEYLYMVAMNTKCKPLGFFEISHGNDNNTLASPKNIFQRALLCGANSMILAHNHPSGCVQPSKEDIELAKTIQEGGKLLGITLLDSIIIGDGYFSFAEEKML